MITVYGIKNCDTCRKALKWMTDEGLEHQFHDFRDDGLDAETTTGFIAALGMDAVINRRSTSWRGLDDTVRAVFDGADTSAAVDVLVANPTLIKRPVFARASGMINGFGAAQKTSLLDE